VKLTSDEDKGNNNSTPTVTSDKMEGFQHAGTAKNKKIIENSPLLAF